MNKSYLVMLLGLTGCASNMAEPPTIEEMNNYRTPYAFMKERMSDGLLGIDTTIESPDPNSLIFKGYYTKIDQTHLKKPYVDAKSYCENYGGKFVLKEPARSSNLTRLMQETYNEGYLGTFNCFGGGQHWKVSVTPFYWHGKVIENPADADTAYLKIEITDLVN